VRLAPGRHLAVAMIPVGGATRRHPALFVIRGTSGGDPPVAILSAASPDPAAAPSSTTTTTQDQTVQPAQTQLVDATAFPFQLPKPPGPGDSQALAVNRTNGGER